VDEASKTLSGKRIVITRAVEQSKSIVQALRAQGATPVLLPMVAFAAPDDPAPLDEALRKLGNFEWVFLTSQNALKAMQERCALTGLPLVEAIAGVKIAAVGPATAEAVQNAGLEVAYVAHKHQGVALAEELSAMVKAKAVLLPRSDRANRDLVEALDRYGAVVTEVVAYKTIRPSEDEDQKHRAELERGVDAILFFSPSAVHHMQDLVGGARFVILSNRVAYLAVGPVTAKALRDTGVQRIIASADVQTEAVVDALAEFFSGAQQGLPAGAK
jgi:uroporphyrinogen III methyltransferase/synthase